MSNICIIKLAHNICILQFAIFACKEKNVQYFGAISFLAEHIIGVCCTTVHVQENPKGLSICLILHIGEKIVNQSIYIYTSIHTQLCLGI